MPSKSYHKLFQPFSQIDPTIRKKFEGSGLGLILSKRLAKLLGGDVVLIQSKPNKGSVFQLSISMGDLRSSEVLSDKKHRTRVARNPLFLKGKRVLVVEDTVDNQLLIQQFLMKAGGDLHIVHNGLEALQACEKNDYDLVLMDMQMPIMDGYSATLRLRHIGFKVPIIALTAHAMKDDLDKCLKVGCDSYLSKPFRRDELLDLVRRFTYKATA
jgi:CheY-like chemotaxis protein